MKIQLIVAAAVAALALAGCGDSKDAPAKPAAKTAQGGDAKAPKQEVRAPAPPPPAGGGKPAPEIPPEILAKIRADLAKNPPPAPAAAAASASASASAAAKTPAPTAAKK
jgi:hypothetical protein